MQGKIVLVLMAALLLVAGSEAAMTTDRTLTTAGSQCLDKFNTLIKTQYSNDTDCATLIKNALSTSDPSKCPAGGADKGSNVQKCMSKTPAIASAWVDFVRSCEVMNVANRAGEAEAATELKPSCFPAFSGMDDFAKYVGSSAASAATSTQAATLLLLAAAAGALAFTL